VADERVFGAGFAADVVDDVEELECRIAGRGQAGLRRDVFARSKDGRSHTPAEFTAVDDAVAAIRVLAAALHELAW